MGKRDESDAWTRHSRRQRLIVALGALLLLSGLLAVHASSATRATAEERLAAAQARWAAHGYRDYRIISRSGDCLQQGEFRGDQIVSVRRWPCLDTIRTVEYLFMIAERAQTWGLTRQRCAPSGCVCRESRAIYVVYDEQLGYPLAIRMRKFRSVDWAYLLQSPARYAGLLGCLNPPEIDLFRVLSLEPLEE